ncbi:MAG: SusC/RagA family TonB-linked outer membrane protein [Paludibacter sp.]
MKRFAKILILLSAVIFSVFPRAHAQEKIVIRGKVISAQDKQELIGVTVVEVNKENRSIASCITNIDGNFVIKVSDKKNKLVFSYIGYKKKEITIGENADIKVAMEDAAHEITEVVVKSNKRQVGSMPIEERDISMAVSRLDASEIADLNVASVDQAMQGRMSGVDIVSNAGDPGSGMSIQIRGTTSINGNSQPLVVVDGIPLETEIGADFDFSTASEEQFSQLLNIAPSDIKEIVVLKDAAANAIWGARAANGVLQITTQRGSISPPKVTLRVTGTYKPLAKQIPTLNGDQYTTMILEAQLNAGTILDPLKFPQVAYDPNNPEYFYNYSQNTDWVDAVSQNAYSQEYNLSVRGGSPKTRYSFSAGYLDDNGNTIGTAFQRLNTRLNLDYSVSDKLRFSADIAYTHSETQKNYVPDTDSENANVRGEAYGKMPNQSIYYYNVWGELTPTYFTPVDNPQGTYPKVYNPVAMALDGTYHVSDESIIPKMSLQFRPNDVWRATFDVGFQASTNKQKKFLPASATGLVWSDNRTNTASDKDGESFTIQTFTKLYYTPQFKDENVHRLIGLFGINTYDRSSYSYQAVTTNLASASLQDPSIASRIYSSGSISSGSSQQRTMSSYVNLNYTLLDRYTIYGNMNLEGNSRFGENYRFGLFPSISGRYRLSGERFMKGLKWLDDLSFRASYGMSGEAPNKDYMYFNKYQTYSYDYMGESATYPDNLELKNLRWEHSYTQNFGFNLVAFSSKLNIEGEYYIRRVEDQFMSNIAIPTTSGFSSMSTNYGTVQNNGWELNVNYNVFKNKDWNVNLAFNMARSENKVIEISEFASLYGGEWNTNGSYLTRTILGQPTGSIYGYLYDGVYLNENQTRAKDANGQTIYTVDNNENKVPVYMKFGAGTSVEYVFKPGDTRYKDINHDGNINYQDIVWLGDINPLLFGGLTPSIKWKQLSLNMVFFFRYGNSVVNMSRMNMENMSGWGNQSTAVLKRWRQAYENEAEAPKDLISRALYGSGYNWLASDRFVEDGSFIRWKSLTFRYNFDTKIVKRLGLSELYLYSTVNNIHVWTNYTGQDPEVSMGGTNKGKDFSTSPVPKSFTFGLNLSF